MAISNRTQLQASIAGHLNRVDLTTQIPDFIVLAEATHKREIRIRDMIQRNAYDVSSRYLTLPTGFLAMRSLRLLYDDKSVRTLTEMTPETLTAQRQKMEGRSPTLTIPDVPQNYAVSGLEIEFDTDPTASGATEVDAELRWYKELPALDSSTADNALLLRAPDIYLYASLAAAAPYLGDDPRLVTWAALYANGRDAINKVDKALGGPLVARIMGSTP